LRPSEPERPPPMADPLSKAGKSKIGEVFAGRYRLEALVGRGGMAEVFRATDLARRTEVAIKIVREEVARIPEVEERFRREGEILRQLAHPSLVAVDTFGQAEDGRTFIVMELLSGETLAQRLKKWKRVSPGAMTAWMTQICDALDLAHEAGVIHRDLKPENIFLVARDDGTEVVKLLDFGVSKFYGRESLTKTGQILGTPRYMAPEQLSADPDIDGRADIYALGVIIYEALAGIPAFPSHQASELLIAILHGDVVPVTAHRPDLRPEVGRVVMCAMARAREARYGSAAELLAAWIDATAGGMAIENQHRGVPTAAMGSTSDEEVLAGGRSVSSVPDPGLAPAPLRPGTFSSLQRQSTAATPLSTPAPPNTSRSSGPPPHRLAGDAWKVTILALGTGLLAAVGVVLLLRWLF
ncbi:MAG: serine/threonine protein kinase, partial [Myxococcales bacterium]|nr:serine/threonine protein kinase [Myxococcales bacterium]